MFKADLYLMEKLARLEFVSKKVKIEVICEQLPAMNKRIYLKGYTQQVDDSASLRKLELDGKIKITPVERQIDLLEV